MLKIKLIDGAQFEEGLLEFTEEYGFCLCEDADAITVRAVQARDGLLTVTEMCIRDRSYSFLSPMSLC